MLALVRRFSAIGVPLGLVLELAVVMVTVDAAGVQIEVEDLGLITNVNHSLMVSHGASPNSPALGIPLVDECAPEVQVVWASYKLPMRLASVSVPGQPRT